MNISAVNIQGREAASPALTGDSAPWARADLPAARSSPTMNGAVE